MGLILTAAFGWIATAIGAVAAWAGALLTSSALAQFFTFAAKIAFLYILSGLIIAALQPFASTLAIQNLGGLGNFAMYWAVAFGIPQAMSTLLSALVVSYGFKMIQKIF